MDVTYIWRIGRRVNGANAKRNSIELGKNELPALKSLRCRDDIVVKPADKAGSILPWRETRGNKKIFSRSLTPSLRQDRLDSYPPLKNLQTFYSDIL